MPPDAGPADGGPRDALAPDAPPPDAPLVCDADDDAALAVVCGGEDCDDSRADTHPGGEEVCDGNDQDCDGAVDEGLLVESFADADGDGFGDAATMTNACGVGPGRVVIDGDCDDADPLRYPGAPLDVPVLVGPDNGALTGSVHGARAGTLTPTFWWRPVPACEATYELQVDDECGIDRASCAFASPELVAASLTETSHRPSAPLPVSMSAPVGRRYGWRVRACDAPDCSDWSTVRYLDVGRTTADFDGDGYGDLAVGSVERPAVAIAHFSVSIYRGGPVVSPDPALAIADPEPVRSGYGLALAAAGDLNADGYADLAVGAPFANVHEGVVYVHLGSRAGISAIPDARLADPSSVLGELFGGNVHAAGDVDADGYADLVIGSLLRSSSFVGVPGAVAIHRGHAGGISSTASVRLTEGAWDSRFGRDVSSGDLDRDGYSDVFVTAQGDSTVYGYAGSATGLVETTFVTSRHPAGDFPFDVFVGDYTGDGLRDIAASTGDQVVIAQPELVGAAPIERFVDYMGVWMSMDSYVMMEVAGSAFFLGGWGYEDSVWMYPASEPWSDANRISLSTGTGPLKGTSSVIVAAIDLDGDGFLDPIASIASDQYGIASLGLFAWRGTTTGAVSERIWRAEPPETPNLFFGQTLLR